MSFATQIMLDSSNLNQLSELLLDLCYEALGEHGRDDPLPDSAITPRNVANAVLGVFTRDDKIDHAWLKRIIIPEVLSSEQRSDLRRALEEFCKFAEEYGNTLVLRYGVSEPLRVHETTGRLKMLFA